MADLEAVTRLLAPGPAQPPAAPAREPHMDNTGGRPALAAGRGGGHRAGRARRPGRVAPAHRGRAERAARRDGAAAPSRRLARRAARELSQCCRHVWGQGPSEFTRAPDPPAEYTYSGPARGGFPWAVCAPFRGGSSLALYVSGTAPAVDAPGLADTQKFTEILVGLIASAHRALRLNRQLAVAGQAWPLTCGSSCSTTRTRSRNYSASPRSGT